VIPRGYGSVAQVHDHGRVVAGAGLRHVEPLLAVDEGASDSLGEAGGAQGEVDLESFVRL